MFQRGFQCGQIFKGKEEMLKMLNSDKGFSKGHRGASFQGPPFGKWSLDLEW